MIPEGGRTSYAGDVLAIVVAETRQQAREAAELVGWTTACCDRHRSLAALEDPEPAVWGTDSNTLSVSEYQRDVDDALAASAHVVEETFRTQRIEHAFLEPEATPAVPVAPTAAGPARVLGRPGRGTTATRSPRCWASSPPDHRRASNGGAFGGKEDMANQAHAAPAAWLLQRPVKCVLSARRACACTQAPPDRDGVPAAATRRPADRGRGADGRRFGGAAVGMKVLERAAGHASGPYHVPTIDVRSAVARTTRSAARSGLRRQPGAVRHGGLPGPAGRASASRLGDPQAQRHPPGQVWGPGQVMDDGAWAPSAASTRSGPTTTAVAAGRAVGLGL